jgi:hypothetical protein
MLDGSALFFEMALIPAVVILIAFMDLACELFLHLPDVPPCGYGSSPNCG